MSQQSMQILGVTNSLRVTSLNRMAMEAAGRVMQPVMDLRVHDISQIPFYDTDCEKILIPDSVGGFANAISDADGLLIVSPEYNHSIPARVKNALDWLSRTHTKPLEGLPVMLLSATSGSLGGARVQYELRRVLDAVGAFTMVKPEVFIGQASRKFDDQGICIDENTNEILRSQVKSFHEWVMMTKRRCNFIKERHGHQQT